MLESSSQHGRIVLENVHFSRGERTIFQDVSLSVPEGSIAAVMGPSGTGKTTLLRLIVGQLRPDRGSVRVDHQSVETLDRNSLLHLRRRIGMLFQSSALFSHLSVFENVAFPLREHTTFGEADLREKVLLKLEAVGLRGARDLMPSELSGGKARRVALARALALEPPIMLYDEPFTGLDPISMGVILKLIKDLNDALGITSIIVSHDVAETFRIADEIYLLSQGRIVAQGTVDAIEKSSDPLVYQFIRGLRTALCLFIIPLNLLTKI